MARIQKSRLIREWRFRKDFRQALDMVDDHIRVEQCFAEDASRVEGMEPFPHVLKDQDIRSVIDGRNVIAKATVYGAIAFIAPLSPILDMLLFWHST